MKIVKVIFYFFIFLFTFGRFLPAYNPPYLVTDFFSSGKIFFFSIFVSLCFFSFKIVKNLYLSWLDWNKNKRLLFNSIAVITIYVSLIASIPILQNLQNNFVIWVNQGRDVTNFINPTLGMSMNKFDADDRRSFDEVQFSSFDYGSFGCEGLIFTPEGSEKSRWNEEYYREIKSYGNKWRWTRKGSFFLANNQNGDGIFTIE